MECTICLNSYKKDSDFLTCPYQCEGGLICKKCVSRVLLDSTQEIPYCMRCKKEWNWEVIEAMGASFVTKFKKHNAVLAFEYEKAHLPECQDLAVEYRYYSELKKEIASNPVDFIYHLRRLRQEKEVVWNLFLENRRDSKKRKEFLKQVTKIDVEIAKVKAQQDEIQVLNADINEFMENLEPGQIDNAPQRPRPARKQMVVKCPTENCRGFLEDDGSCPICKTLSCTACMKPKGEEHECNPDDKATRDCILQNCKPCPRCAVLTQRSEGCPQMFCVQCKVAWNWNTQEIEEGPIHNPHYFEWQREMRRRGIEVNENEDRQDRCRIPHYFGGDERVDLINDFLRRYRHAEDNHRRRQIGLNPHRNLLSRLKFIIGEMSEKMFKADIQRQHSLRRKRQSFNDFYVMYTEALGSILLRYAHERKNERKFNKELKYFDAFIRSEMDKLCNRFGGMSKCKKLYDKVLMAPMPEKKKKESDWKIQQIEIETDDDE